MVYVRYVALDDKTPRQKQLELGRIYSKASGFEVQPIGAGKAQRQGREVTSHTGQRTSEGRNECARATGRLAQLPFYCQVISTRVDLNCFCFETIVEKKCCSEC